MPSKTPTFDKTLDEILENLRPHKRTCHQCQGVFDIFQEDIKFYYMLRVPPPKLCPLCRKKRRFGHLMRVPKFFKKPCSAPGHTEEVITVFPPLSPHKIFDFSYWYSDDWEAGDFGRNYDFSQLFFPQFKKLFFNVPHIPLERSPTAINCDYMVGGTDAKNAYYCGMGLRSENIMYCYDTRWSRDLIDCSSMNNSELCYGSVGSYNCNRCVFVVECGECLDSAFLYDCKNCRNCFLSSNLRNKSYVFNNKPLTKEEYQKKINSINLSNQAILNDCLQKFKKNILPHSLHRAIKNISVSNSVGDTLRECYSCYFVFRSEKSENVRYADNILQTRDSMDVVNNLFSEKLYETTLNASGSDNRFSMYLRNCSYIEYSSECRNCHYCFGCVGLQNKQFHIFNKSYLESRYWEILDQIKTKMLTEGEYGEFFPLQLGLMPYQCSNGQKEFPLSIEKAKILGIPWYDEPEPNIPKDAHLLNVPHDIPVDINKAQDDILNSVIICEVTKRPFRLIKGELDFYKKIKLPFPTKHPWQRMQERNEFERPIWLYPFKCPCCGQESFAVYSFQQQKKIKILCEKCYLKEVV